MDIIIRKNVHLLIPELSQHKSENIKSISTYRYIQSIKSYNNDDYRTVPFRSSPTIFRDGSIGVSIDLNTLNNNKLKIGSYIENRQFIVPHEDEIGPAAAVEPQSNWGFEALSASSLISAKWSGNGIRVGVLDSGIDVTHRMFSKTSIIDFRCFSGDGAETEGDPSDTQWHGTHVCGIIAGKELGINTGLAPDCELYVGQVLQGWRGTVASIKSGLLWMKDVVKPHVLNLSFEWPGLNDEWHDEISSLEKSGTIIIIAAGNSYLSEEKTSSPGNYIGDRILRVGAYKADNTIWAKSSGGIASWPMGSAFPGQNVSVPNLSAPGADIVSAGPFGSYRAESGTSQAAPHVSAIAACLLSAGRFDQDQVIRIIKEACIDRGDYGDDIRFGIGTLDGGRLNALAGS